MARSAFFPTQSPSPDPRNGSCERRRAANHCIPMTCPKSSTHLNGVPTFSDKPCEYKRSDSSSTLNSRIQGKQFDGAGRQLLFPLRDPRWMRAAAKHYGPAGLTHALPAPKRRASTQSLINHLRAEVWGQAPHSPHFATSDQSNTNCKKVPLDLAGLNHNEHSDFTASLCVWLNRIGIPKNALDAGAS